MSWRTADSELTLQAACDAYSASFMADVEQQSGFFPGRKQFERAVAAACDVAVAAYIEEHGYEFEYQDGQL